MPNTTCPACITPKAHNLRVVNQLRHLVAFRYASPFRSVSNLHSLPNGWIANLIDRNELFGLISLFIHSHFNANIKSELLFLVRSFQLTFVFSTSFKLFKSFVL
jgi:hypothetical protein